MYENWFNIFKISQYNLPYWQTKEEKYMIISIDAKKLFGKTQHPFVIKTLSKLEIAGNFLNLAKNIYKKTYSYSHT